MFYFSSSLCLWGVLRKKPLVTVKNAHGQTTRIGDENWISSVAALQYTDLVASGKNIKPADVEESPLLPLFVEERLNFILTTGFQVWHNQLTLIRQNFKNFTFSESSSTAAGCSELYSKQ